MIDSMNMMQLVSANIKRLFDSRPGSYIDFARTYYMTPQYVTRMCNAENNGIDFMDILRIASYFNVDIRYFITQQRTPAYEYETDTE